MKLPVVAFAALSLLACEDSGPVPFGDHGLSGGSSGSAGSSGDGGSAGSDGGGGYGGSAGSAGCKGGPGTSCATHGDCCQVDSNGNLCVGQPIYQCAAKCYSSSECAGYCCVKLDGQSYGACLTGSSYACMP